ncbi:amidohydrolase [Nocardioides sp.]|uniref:amidohydrolase n=1 Tax=Nocardioides sp. TaxID=35761 RepID=UPI0039E53DB7
MTTYADTVLRGGTVLDLSGYTPGMRATPEWLASRPTAVAVKNDLVVALGEDAEALIGPDTQLIELDGSTVIPGLADTHLHYTGFAVTQFVYTKMGTDVFRDIADLPAYLTKDRIDASGWIRGHGSDPLVLGRNITAKDIDAALDANGIAGTPVVLFDWSGHALTLNQVALDLCGITKDTPEPVGGVIVRDAEGNPEGFLQDAALVPVIETIPPVPAEQLRDAYAKAQAYLHGLGLTALTEPGMGPGHVALLDGSPSPAAMEVLADFAASGDLSLRVSVMALPVGTGGGNAAAVREHLSNGLHKTFERPGIDPHRLRIGAVKVFADGTPQNGTTWHKDPIHDMNEPGHRCGHMVLVGDSDDDKVEELKEIIRAVESFDLQIGVHCIGDRTVETVIDALAEIIPNDPKRPYLIHTTELYPQGAEKAGSYGISLNFNPTIISTFIRHMPEEYRRRCEPLGLALRAGANIGITSDAPVVHPDWRPAFVYAVTRSHCWEGEVPADDLRYAGITTLDALAAMTSRAASRERDESWRGTLAVGQKADLAVLEGGWPDNAEVETLLDRAILLTMVDGRVVHRA